MANYGLGLKIRLELWLKYKFIGGKNIILFRVNNGLSKQKIRIAWMCFCNLYV